MIRVIGAGMIIFAASFAGVILNSRLYRRQKYLESFITALEHLKTHICFADYSMQKALTASGEICDTGSVFYETAENMTEDGIKAAWKNAVYKNAEKLSLKASDSEALAVLGERLGVTDSEDQRKNIDNVIAALRVNSAEAREDYKKNGRLYRSCGVLCGVLAALLLL